MPWKAVPKEDDERDGYECIRHEALYRDDDGTYLGSVMQFYDGHSSYPLGRNGRYGAYDTFENAKKAVETMEH